jgi:hypothetical protein
MQLESLASLGRDAAFSLQRVWQKRELQRFGYGEEVALLQATEKSSALQLELLQIARLRRVLKLAKPERNWAKLRAGDWNSFVALPISDANWKAGSSGAKARRQAYLDFHRDHVGSPREGKRAEIVSELGHGTAWLKHWGGKELLLSEDKLSEATAEKLISQLVHFRPTVLRASAKALNQVLRLGLVMKIPAVICSGVISDRTLRTSLENRLGCRVFEQAQHETMGGFWFECRYQRMHTHPLFGVTEIVRPNGSACATGEAGEVVLTGLLDTENPVIRVKSGDWAAWADEDRCPCGRAMAILETVARPRSGTLRDVA